MMASSENCEIFSNLYFLPMHYKVPTLWLFLEDKQSSFDEDNVC